MKKSRNQSSAKPSPRRKPASAKRSSSNRSSAKSSSRLSSGSRSSTSRSSSKKRKTSTHREGLQEVLKDSLKDIYYAEKQLAKALKKLSKSVTHEELREAMDTHREQTEQQIEMLEDAFAALEMRAAGKKCPVMDGLIEEANEHVKEMDKGPALDAALLVGAQKIEHYEIAAYGSMRAFARALELSECEQIFDEILQQESETDELLTQIADTVNQDALNEESMQLAEMEE